ncbi:MAG: hypothetical protein IPK80_10650 [Nannocystis sp.]|jgi:phage tail tape-measure protein|nr:hypothetical protein [Nannocystis sp.]
MLQTTGSNHRWVHGFTLTVAAAMMTIGLGACGAEEASAMTKFADQMCACKDVACAEKLFPEIEKMSAANEGKEVVAAVAEKYNRELDRTQKCYDKLHEDAEKTEAAPQ